MGWKLLSSVTLLPLVLAVVAVALLLILAGTAIGKLRRGNPCAAQ
jgi:hypothetical protein